MVASYSASNGDNCLYIYIRIHDKHTYAHAHSILYIKHNRFKKEVGIKKSTEARKWWYYNIAQ